MSFSYWTIIPWTLPLNQEIITIVGIWVACTACCVITVPRHRTTSKHQPTRTNGTCGHFVQIVGGNKIIGVKSLALQVPSITIHFHTVWIVNPALAMSGRFSFIVLNDQHQAWRIISSLVSAGISSEGDCLQPMRLNDNKQANSKLNFFISSNIK